MAAEWVEPQGGDLAFFVQPITARDPADLQRGQISIERSFIWIEANRQPSPMP